MTVWRWLFGRGGAEAELAREIDAHIAERADDLMDEGWSRGDALAQARREFGNRTLHAERSREVWIAPWLSSVWQDLHYAARSVTRQPGFTLSAVGILALGIGPVTAIFTMFNGRVLRPWPVRDPSSIAIVKPLPRPTEQYGALPSLEYRYLRDHSRSFTHLAAWQPGGGPVRYGKTKVFVQSSFVTANYFDMLDVRMHLGRTFLPEEDDYTSPRAVAIISERLWREYFGASGSIVGERILVYDRPFTIVGVAQAGFFDVEPYMRRDLWMPRASVALVFASQGHDPTLLKALADPRNGTIEQVAGRLAPGVASAAAQAELDVLARQFCSSFGLDPHGVTLRTTRPISRSRSQALSHLSASQMMFGALLLVMLLACANVGNLILARGLARQREIAIRLSLGASRMRVTRQLLTESLLLSVLAGAVGLWLGILAMRTFTGSRESLLANPDQYVADLAVIAFTFVTSLIACLAAGVMPAVRSTRVSIAARAADGGTGRPGAGRLRTTLLAAQLALSMVLLVCAGLLTRAVGHAMTIDPGFDIHDVQVIAARLPEGASRERSSTFHRTLRDALAADAASHVAQGEFTAITSSHRTIPFRPDGETARAPRMIVARDVSERYFSVLGIPLLAGRALADDGRAMEVVINQSAAQLLWPAEDPVGKRLVTGAGGDERYFTVVGVAQDVPVMSLSEIVPVVYQPLRSGGLLFVRDRSPAMVDRIGSVARAIEPEVDIAARPLAEDISMATRNVAAASQYLWAIGLVALLLATAGAFGVFAHSVEERRREIGVRMALGAEPRQVMGTVVGGARRAVLLGVGAGLLLSSAAAPLLGRVLYGLSPFDPVTYAGISAILVTAALAATWIPARRATQIDPAATLRED
jgi:predicted permease